jgi:hypothetical protein
MLRPEQDSCSQVEPGNSRPGGSTSCGARSEYINLDRAIQMLRSEQDWDLFFERI